MLFQKHNHSLPLRFQQIQMVIFLIYNILVVINKIIKLRMKQLENGKDSIEVSPHGRQRLITQNKKLRAEVFTLQSNINYLMGKKIASDFEQIQENEQLKARYRQDLQKQLKYIARLKKELRQVKATIADNKYDEIRKEEDQLVFIKKQLRIVASERDTLILKKHEKVEALQYHKPINNQTAQILQKYKKIKAENGELKSKIHKLQSQIQKYHTLKQLSRSSVPKQYDNPDYHYIKINNEILQMKKEMKRIDDKWKSKLESIDHQYFSLKQITKQKYKQIEEMQREQKNVLARTLPMKSETEIKNNRQRVSSVLISAKKRQQIQNLIEQQNSKLKRLEPKSIDNKPNLKSKGNKDIENKLQLKIENVGKEKLNVKDQIKSERRWQNPDKPTVTQYSQSKNQLQSKSFEKIQQKLKSKPKKMMESVGVGTSFYYQDN